MIILPDDNHNVDKFVFSRIITYISTLGKIINIQNPCTVKACLNVTLN